MYNIDTYFPRGDWSFSKVDIEQAPAQIPDPHKQAKQTMKDLFQTTVLKENDTKTFLDYMQSLSAKIKHEVDPASRELMIGTMVEVKKIIGKHKEVFSQADQDHMQAIFFKNFIINGENVLVDVYPWAQSLKKLSSIFIGDLTSGDLKDQLFAKQYPAIAAYLENKTLPDNIEQLFELFNVANVTGYKELEEDIRKKIFGIGGPNADKLWQLAFDSGNNELVMECLPYIINGKSSKKIVEIYDRVNEKLSQGWFSKLKDGATKGKLLQARYETGEITLGSVEITLNKILEEAKSCDMRVFLTTKNIIRKRDAILVYKPEYSELCKMLSQIKAIKHVDLGAGWELGSNGGITFPYVERVGLTSKFVEGSAMDSIELKEWFPDAKQYDIYPENDEVATRVLGKIREDITDLNFEVFDQTKSVTDVTARLVANKFKNLIHLKWWVETSITYEAYRAIVNGNRNF